MIAVELSKANLVKVKRAITWYGSQHQFWTPKLDKFKEPTEEKEKTLEVTGLYHQGSSNWLNVLSEEAGEIHSKDTEYIAVLYSDTVADELKQGYEVTLNGKDYEVNGIADIGNLGIILDISLEVKI